MTIIVGSKIIEGIKGLQTSAVKERMVVAIPALIAFPVIDYFNKSVDEDTRKYSAVKSAIKVFIGTVDGLFARHVGQKIGEKWAPKLGEKLAKGEIKIPGTEKIAEAFKEATKNPEAIVSFSKSLGKTMAFVATLTSIVVMDIPFIDKALDFTMKKLFPNREQ
ncbi:MAG: hypothetical protein ACD_20C00183G0005 [uncultured bacterium]|nr:MAG: hypothetical protein ACD_20C00183G0005 [uncultured bacterium]